MLLCYISPISLVIVIVNNGDKEILHLIKKDTDNLAIAQVLYIKCYVFVHLDIEPNHPAHRSYIS
jgi:hypothetical protein